MISKNLAKTYERYTPFQGWEIPAKVDFDEKKSSLNWSFGHGKKIKRPPTDLLEQFNQLAYADEEKNLAFAKKFGVLGTCRHGYPVNTQGRLDKAVIPKKNLLLELLGGISKDHSPTDCRPVGWRDEERLGIDHLFIWKLFSRWFLSICNLSAQILANRGSEVRDVRRLLDPFPEYEPQRKLETTVRTQSDSALLKEFEPIRYGMIEDLINQWLELAAIRPVFMWKKSDDPHYSFCGMYSGLFPALVFQLMLTVCRVGGLIICSECANGFTPSKRPKLNERQYCENCRNRGKVPERDAARDYRKRKLIAIEMFLKNESVTLSEIFKEIRKLTKKPNAGSEDIVKKWIGEGLKKRGYSEHQINKMILSRKSTKKEVK